MITKEEIKPGLEIVEVSNGMTISARNGRIETTYKIVDQRCEFSWNVLILKKDGYTYPKPLTYYLSTGEVERCYIKE